VKLLTFIKLMAKGQSALMFKLFKMSNEFYRACFISTAISQGIYENFFEEKSTLEQLCEKFNIGSNREGLAAWLELGVSLGELKRVGNEFRIKGKLSKALLKSNNDAYKALLEEIVKYYYIYIINTPTMLKEHKWFPFDETPGELVARSSRLSEPFMFDAVDAIIPRRGDFQLLEVGCGSGIYIQRACARNPELRAVGLELQEKVANSARKNIKTWGLENRATIEHRDVRNYSSSRKFDLITLHQNIYYFPVADRGALAKHLLDYLKPGGQVLLTTVCQGGGPTMQVLNIWVSTTEGYGPLPYPDQLCQQFKDAGFTEVKTKRLIPFESFWAFVATKTL
jgi:protein-L-isoaspartate O-methyltransferase